MSQTHTGTAAPVRASDAERDQAAEILRAGYAEGRLSRAELDERIAAAYAAKTRADLSGLTTDLPGAVPAEATGYGRPPAADLPVVDPAPRASMHPNLCLLLCLLFCFPPGRDRPRHQLDRDRPPQAAAGCPAAVPAAWCREPTVTPEQDDRVAVALAQAIGGGELAAAERH